VQVHGLGKLRTLFEAMPATSEREVWSNAPIGSRCSRFGCAAGDPWRARTAWCVLRPGRPLSAAGRFWQPGDPPRRRAFLGRFHLF
jgi:hypothetical protein